jgi:hypothetical protein
MVVVPFVEVAMPKLLLALCAAVALGACSSAKPAPTGAGSTAVLRLLRDWRGVWTGRATESPMGAMPYVLYVTEEQDTLHARLAKQKDPTLDSMRHEYDFVNFKAGTPAIRYSLAQRATQHDGEVLYEASLSTDDEAVFCDTVSGCDKVKMVVTRISDKALNMRTLVHEALHSDIELRFAGTEIPKDADVADDSDRPPPPKLDAPKTKKGKGKTAKKAGGEDEDLYLEEHLDKDIGETRAEEGEVPNKAALKKREE